MIFHNYPNDVGMSQRFTTNKQRCSDVNATALNLQRWTNVASTLNIGL